MKKVVNINVGSRERSPMFETPSEEDFVRMLADIVENTQSIAAQRVSEVQHEFEKAVNPSAGYLQAVYQTLSPIHKDRVARAMALTVSIAQRSGLPFKKLCTTAEEFLKSHAEAFSTLAIDAPHLTHSTNSTSQASLLASFREPFIRQIDNGLQELRVGYIGERSIVMSAAETVQGMALRLLSAFYNLERQNPRPYNGIELGKTIGLSETQSWSALKYLQGKALLDGDGAPARITPSGIDAIEDAQLHPDKTTPVFPSVKYNITIHGTGVGSQVNVATTGSSQVSRVSETDPAILQQLIEGVRQLVEQATRSLPMADLSPEEYAAATAALAELRDASESANPHTGRLRRGLESLQRVMEHAAGHVIGAGILAHIDKLLAIAFSGT